MCSRIGVAVCFFTGSVFASDPRVAVGIASAEAPSAGGGAIAPPVSRDSNRNGYTKFEIGRTFTGPFDVVQPVTIGGFADWRRTIFAGLTPATIYYVRVTTEDPDGVLGTNPQVLGPIMTSSGTVNQVSV